MQSIVTLFVSSAYLFCRDKVSSVATDLLCVYWNSYVAPLFLYSFFKFVSRPSFYVVTTFLLVLVVASYYCCDIVSCCCRSFLSRPSLLCLDKTFAFSSSLCRDPIQFCRDKISLPCVGIFVVTWKSPSRPCLSMLSLFLCRDLKIPVATTKTSFQL